MTHLGIVLKSLKSRSDIQRSLQILSAYSRLSRCHVRHTVHQMSVRQDITCRSQHPDLLPLVVSQRDALRGNLEVHDGGSKWGSRVQCLRYGLGHRLRTCQGLHLHWVDIEHIACWEKSKSLVIYKNEKKEESHWYKLYWLHNESCTVAIQRNANDLFVQEFLPIREHAFWNRAGVVQTHASKSFHIKHSACYRWQVWMLLLKDMCNGTGPFMIHLQQAQT